MIDDKERREVAARLRANHRHDSESQGTFIARMVKGSGMVTALYVCRLPKLLADLIDRPTCTIKRGAKSGYPTTWGVCSRCGALVNAERAVSTATEYLPTRYCPNCGAGVLVDYR